MNYIYKIIACIGIFISQIHTTFAASAANSNNEQESMNLIEGLSKVLSTDTILRIIYAIIILAFTFLVAKIVRIKVFTFLEGKLGGEGANKQEMLFMTSRVINITIIITGLTAALGVLGVDMTIFMGGIGFGIGFTLRTFLSNFIAGIIMVSQGIYHTNDLIQVDEKQGRILRINTLFTTAQQLDGVIFTIPNIYFLDKEVKNYNSSEKRRIDIDLHFDYDADIIKIKSVLKKVALSFDEILTSPEAKVIVEGFDDSYIRVQYRPWILSDSNFINMKSNVLETINLAFKQAGIDVAKQKITMITETPES